MTATTSNAGGILTPEQVGALVVQPLIATSIAGQALTAVQITSHEYRVPIVTADPSASWTAEGAEISVTDADIDELTVTPKKLAALTIITNELAADSSPQAAQVIGDGLVRDLTRKTDQALFATAAITNGPQAGETLGTLSGISTISAGTSYTNADAFSDAIYAAADANAIVDTFVTNPATAMELSKLKEATGSNKPLLGADASMPGQRQILGVPLLTSPAVPTTGQVVWGISRANAYLVIREGAEVVADSSAYFSSDRTAIRAKLRIGFAFPHPKSIVKITVSA